LLSRPVTLDVQLKMKSAAAGGLSIPAVFEWISQIQK
jgi:hypothetical protein